jgi:hypothetical protein
VARCWDETISILSYIVCCLIHRTITFYLYCWCRQITHCFDPDHRGVSSCNCSGLQTKLSLCRRETRSSELPVMVPRPFVTVSNLFLCLYDDVSESGVTCQVSLTNGARQRWWSPRVPCFTKGERTSNIHSIRDWDFPKLSGVKKIHCLCWQSNQNSPVLQPAYY